MGRPSGSKYTEYVTLRIDPELKARLDEIAEREERSIAQVVRLILRDALKNRKKSKK
jgi:hypothetical protein